MRTLWKGAISFGLVTIPVSLYPATRKEELKFRMLRKSDLSPINYKRVAEADGKEVPWEEIVKGYEHEKGKYVILKEEDFARVDVEATQTVDIINFVKIDDVDPLLFYKPYYLEVGKGGDKAYVLLREALVGKRKDSIYEVGLRTGDWIKLKLLKEQEFVIGGYTEPEGSRQFFGSIIVDFYRFLQGKSALVPLSPREQMGQGITASEMRLCHWVEPQMVCQVNSPSGRGMSDCANRSS